MSPSSFLSLAGALRLRPIRNRLLCLVRLPWPEASDTHTRELALVASATSPYLRRLTVYRRRATPPSYPDTPPKAA